jgi:hypothetical protein
MFLVLAVAFDRAGKRLAVGGEFQLRRAFEVGVLRPFQME